MADRTKSSQSLKASDKTSEPATSAPARRESATAAATLRGVRQLMSASTASGRLTSVEASALQSTLGNRAVGRLCSPCATNDSPLRETASSGISPQTTGEGFSTPVQRRAEAADSSAPTTAEAGNSSAQTTAASGGQVNPTGIPVPVLRGMEGFFGHDFSGVRVHANSADAPAMNALGYTRGDDVHFAPGLYNPQTSEGLSLLGHELTHVVQQREGRVAPTAQLKNGLMLNDDNVLEREADERGARAAAATTRQLKTSGAARVESSSAAEVESGDGSVSQLPSNRAQAAVQRRGAEAGVMQMARSKVSARSSNKTTMDDTAIQQYFDAVAAHAVMANAQAAIQQALLAMQHQTPTATTTETQDTDMDVETVQQKRAGRDVVQLAATATGYNGGTMDEHAAQPHPGAVNNVLLATINWGNPTAANTSTQMDSIDLKTHPGGVGVGATRPNNWAEFIAMVNQNNLFVQGHTLHEDLGGDNGHDNLSPFTHSLNALHYHRVEKHVLNQTLNHYADYDVDINYTGNAGIAGWATGQFNGMAWATQNTAMVGAGVITAAQGAANTLAGAIPPVELAAGQAWITNYVNNTFPSDIDCTVTFIDDQGGGNYTQSAAQQVNITNDF